MQMANFNVVITTDIYIFILPKNDVEILVNLQVHSFFTFFY